MANICSNKFVLHQIDDNEKDFKEVLKTLSEYIDNHVIEGELFYEEDDNWVEGWFDSKWTFPRDDFEKMIKGYVYFRCLSEEYGFDYVAMNVYNIGWKDEQCFNLY